MAGPPNPLPADLTEAVAAIKEYADSTIRNNRARDGWELLSHLFSDDFVARFKLPKARALTPSGQRQRQPERRFAKPHHRQPYQQSETREAPIPQKLLLTREQQARYDQSVKTLAEEEDVEKAVAKCKADAVVEKERIVRLQKINLKRQKLDQEAASLDGIHTGAVPRQISCNYIVVEQPNHPAPVDSEAETIP